MKLIGAGLDRGIENRGSRAAVFCAEVRGLDLEFLNSVDRRKNDKVRAVEEINRVGIVINAIQHVIVLRRPITIGRKGAGRSVASRVRFGGVHAGGQLGQEGEVPAVQRKVIHAALVDYLAHGGIFRLEHRSGRSDFDHLSYGSGLELEIDQNPGAHVDRDVQLRFPLEALRGNVKLVTSNSHRAEIVDSFPSGRSRQAGAGAFVGDRDLRAADDGTRRVRDCAGNGPGVNLSTERKNERSEDSSHQQTAQNTANCVSVHELSFEPYDSRPGEPLTMKTTQNCLLPREQCKRHILACLPSPEKAN